MVPPHLQTIEVGYRKAIPVQNLDVLLEIPWLIEDVIPMTSHSFTSEHGREPQPLRNLVFWNYFIAAFCITNNKLAHLQQP